MDFNNDQAWHVKLKSHISNAIAFNKHLTPTQQGLAYALLILFLIQSSNLILNHTFILSLAYNLINLFIIIFSIFSFFAWLSLAQCISLSESHIYLIFLTCFISEFLIQFFSFNMKILLNFNTSEPNATHMHHTALDSFYQIAIILALSLLTYIYSNIRPAQFASLVTVICLTRFHASIYLAQIIPAQVCPYLAYVCALSGVVFSKYIESNFSQLNAAYASVNTHRKNSKSQKMLRSNYICSRCNACSMSLFSKLSNFSNSSFQLKLELSKTCSNIHWQFYLKT